MDPECEELSERPMYDQNGELVARGPMPHEILYFQHLDTITNLMTRISYMSQMLCEELGTRKES